MKLRDANLQAYKKNKKNKKTFTHPPSCILPSFSQNASQLLLRQALKVCEHNFFLENK